MDFIKGGVCAAAGFKAGGVHCGIRKNKTKKDLALIVSEKEAVAACVYTRNLVKGAPIAVTKNHVANGYARAIICNSGIANTCAGDGIETATGMCALAAQALDISQQDIVVASTGVIGPSLSLEPVRTHIDALAAGLSADDNGSADAATAIMTTDTVKKEVAVAFEIDGVQCKIGGIAKGSGMIHPNMATMLVFVTTDCNISPGMLQKALSDDVPDSFNMLSIDGDTSTNDMVTVLANGMAQNSQITEEGPAYTAFCAALAAVTRSLCRMLAADGEGATKLLDCIVSGAADVVTAKTAAKSVICSSLVKSAMFGADANWGRVLCALGYSGAELDTNKINVSFKSEAGEVAVCKNGAGIPFDEDAAKKILTQDDIQILVDLQSGDASAQAWGCDLTYDYVKINGDYRT
ncbi:MAG: bifunctional ornithine acetyltransferase/N-acetylglutamate synthase [Clostridiales bacterium]|jgi:glutamate N-acetyltransferase/amino-acid N-acetyltransferase|nr:bifunctional ornithine acetyltransferase/N-acetylglutamate synthase [Clostridiales bacterium]